MSLLAYTHNVSVQEEIVVETVEPENLGPTLTRLQAAPGSGKTEMFVRVLLTANFDSLLEDSATRGEGSAELVRNALVHELRLSEIVQGAAPELGVDGFISLLGNALALFEVKSTPPHAHFTDAELDELKRGGLLRDTDADHPSRASARSATQLAALLADSLSVSQVADLLRVDQSRIRQRLTERTLYGVKLGRAWRLPSFQFTKDRQVRGLDQVLPELPSTLHPVAVHRWLTTPNTDLDMDGETVSPLEWLEATGDASQVVAIAHDL